MNKTITLSFVLLLTLAPMTGCIENMQDLKERLGQDTTAATSDPEPVKQATTNTTKPVTNETKTPPKPPVARITVFGANGALVYKSPFTAEDEASPIYTTAPATLQLIATDSEVLEPGAKLDKYTWDFAGMKMEGAQVSHELTEPGLYPLMLTVTDTKGGKDMQHITLAVAPQPFDVVTTITTGTVIGVEGIGQGGSATYDLSFTIDDKLHTVSKLVFKTTAGPECDTILEVIPPSGEGAQGPQDTGSQETITFGAGEEGTYTVNVTGYACVSQGVPIEVTATYLQVIEGLEGGDGHAHAH